MAHLKLDKALADLQGVRKDGSSFLLSEEQDVTFYAALGQEVVQVTRVSRVDPTPEMVTIWTHKGERFFVPPEHIVAIKAGAPAKVAVGSAGFRA
jgi:hypothetical protein